MEKKCENTCPNCGSENIEWDDKEWNDSGCQQDAFCNDCECSFTECYEYSKTIWEK
jgi:hypothetical protein